MKHLSVVISNIFGKKRNSIVTFQSGHLTEQPKIMDDLGCFDLKMFRNCPIRIEIITGSHIFRDRPFNLKGGGYGFLFRSEIIFRTTQELEYLSFLSRKAQMFFSRI